MPASANRGVRALSDVAAAGPCAATRVANAELARLRRKKQVKPSKGIIFRYDDYTNPVAEPTLAFIAAAIALGGGVVWLASTAIGTDVTNPDRLVAELRLAQYVALLLVLAAGVYMGLALGHDEVPGTGFDIAIATGFFLLAGIATTWEPTRALTALAMAWTAHAAVDLAHVIDILPATIVPVWYPTACAMYDVAVAGLCYLPMLRR